MGRILNFEFSEQPAGNKLQTELFPSEHAPIINIENPALETEFSRKIVSYRKRPCLHLSHLELAKEIPNDRNKETPAASCDEGFFVLEPVGSETGW